MPENCQIDDFEKIEFPKCKEILRKWSIAKLDAELKGFLERLEYFRYLEDSNDVREGYEQFIDDADKFLRLYSDMILDIKEALKYYESIKEHAVALSKVSKQYDKRIKKYHNLLLDRGIDPLDPMETINSIDEHISVRAQELIRRKNKLDKVEQEIEIKNEVLNHRMSEMEEALRHRYTLTESQKRVLLEEKDMILDGIEQWGTIAGALRNNKNITSKASTIQSYTQLFPEFGQAIQISKALFKDRLDAIMVERAIEGTKNPVFGKGEHIGDYRIKDNKLLLELMKAKVPEEYNKKAVETVKNTQVNNLNIISYANADESALGFTKNVGVVTTVDDTGKVERIMQESKMKEFYSKKEGAEIIEAEIVEETDDGTAE